MEQIIEQLKRKIAECEETGEALDEYNWGMETGVLISANDAKKIVSALSASQPAVKPDLPLDAVKDALYWVNDGLENADFLPGQYQRTKLCKEALERCIKTHEQVPAVKADAEPPETYDQEAYQISFEADACETCKWNLPRAYISCPDCGRKLPER